MSKKYEWIRSKFCSWEKLIFDLSQNLLHSLSFFLFLLSNLKSCPEEDTCLSKDCCYLNIKWWRLNGYYRDPTLYPGWWMTCLDSKVVFLSFYLPTFYHYSFSFYTSFIFRFFFLFHFNCFFSSVSHFPQTFLFSHFPQTFLFSHFPQTHLPLVHILNLLKLSSLIFLEYSPAHFLSFSSDFSLINNPPPLISFYVFHVFFSFIFLILHPFFKLFTCSF